MTASPYGPDGTVNTAGVHVTGALVPVVAVEVNVRRVGCPDTMNVDVTVAPLWSTATGVK